MRFRLTICFHGQMQNIIDEDVTWERQCDVEVSVSVFNSSKKV